jgi:hypothetical protein
MPPIFRPLVATSVRRKLPGLMIGTASDWGVAETSSHASASAIPAGKMRQKASADHDFMVFVRLTLALSDAPLR